tara:strand:- start:1645 stop:2106 length:462 start_codon:yes stop_codon:yes gene_type:complete
MKLGSEWGKHTWIFFHCLAEKINPNYFSIMAPTIFTWIVDICNILPCPDCSSHASTFLKTYKYYDKIKTKEDFKMFLLFMHNTVNQRVGKPIYNKNILQVYKTKSFEEVTANWFNHFRVNLIDVKLIYDKKQRYYLKNKILRELKSKIKYFDI